MSTTPAAGESSIPNAPAATPTSSTSRESRKKGRMPGSKNFTDHEIFTYIKFIHERLPSGFGDWDILYKEYNKWAERNGFTKRPQESLKKQWNQRVNLTKTADDPRCPWDVQLVKKVLAEIEAGHRIYNIDDSEHSHLNPQSIMEVNSNSNHHRPNAESSSSLNNSNHHHLLPTAGGGPFTPFSPANSSMDHDAFNPAPRSPDHSPALPPQDPPRRPHQPDLLPAPAPPGPFPTSSHLHRPHHTQPPSLDRFLDFPRQSDHDTRPPVQFHSHDSYEKSLQLIRLEDKLERLQTRHADEVARLQEKVERLDRRNRKLEQENQVLRIKNMLLRGEDAGSGEGKRKRARVAKVDIDSEKEDQMDEEETDDEEAAYTVAPEAAQGEL